MESPEIQELKDGITFSIRVQPRSSKNEIIGIQSGSLKVKLTSPPIENAANQLCIKLFSQWLDINKSKIQIISGLKSRNKKIKIYGLNKSDFESWVMGQGSERTNI